MDKKEALPLSGLPSYYTHRGIPGSGTGIQGSLNINPLSSANITFQSTTGSSSIGPTLSGNPSSTASPRGFSIGAPFAVTQGEPLRRKRGRPRKYGREGAISLVLSSSLSIPSSTSTPTQKRRGRPPGTGPKQQLASLSGWQSNSAGMGFTPHVIAISVGEDITKKIMSFCDQGPRSTCIMSANGAISTAILHQPSISGGTVTYEGWFEILCLCGSYLFTDNGYPHGQSGGLSVSLASPDGRVIGGGVGGALIAATPIQVIVGSFLCGSSKTKSKAGESLEIARSSHHQTDDNPVTPVNVQPRQNPE